MAKNDIQYGGWNYYSMQCGRTMTLISSYDCTLQCGMWLWNRDSKFTKWHTLQCYTWLWDDMPWNSPKRSPIGILHLVSISTYHHSRHVILHQSAKFYPNRTTLNRKKWHRVDLQYGGSQPSWIL